METTTLLLDAIEASLRPLQSAVEDHTTESRGDRMTPEQLEEAAAISDLTWQGLQGLRQLIERFLQRGVERSLLASILKRPVQLMEDFAPRFSAAIKADRLRAGSTDAPAAAIAQLEDFARRADALRQEFASMLAWAEAKAPALDPELVGELEGAGTGREYVNFAGFKSEMLAGDG
jgi:hypothetical protein